MNKAELVKRIAEKAGISRRAASNALDAMLKTVSSSIAKGEKVRLVGFGTFSTSARPERTGHNPQTGQPIKLKASKQAKFTAGKALKTAVASACVGRTGGGGPGKKG